MPNNFLNKIIKGITDTYNRNKYRKNNDELDEDPTQTLEFTKNPQSVASSSEAKRRPKK